MDSMDEEVGRMMGKMESTEGVHLHRKDSEHSHKPETLESVEVVAQEKPVSPKSSFHLLADMLEGKNKDSFDASEPTSTSHRGVGDEGGVMVEELTVRNYDNSNSAIVGASNKRDTLVSNQKRLHIYHQSGGGSGSRGSHGNGDNNQTMANAREDVANPSNGDDDENNEKSLSSEHDRVSSGMLPQGIKTKILSKAGFSEFFVKSTLKGKGVTYKGLPHNRFRTDHQDQDQYNVRAESGPVVASKVLLEAAGRPVLTGNAAPSPMVKPGSSSSCDIAAMGSHGCEDEGVSLRKWLKGEQHLATKAQCLHIFSQIVQVVDDYHSQGVALRHLWPSCFKLLHSYQVRYIGSVIKRESFGNTTDRNISDLHNPPLKRGPVEQGRSVSFGLSAKKQKVNDNANISRWPLFQRPGIKIESVNRDNINAAGTQYMERESNEHQSHVEYRSGIKSHSLHTSSMAADRISSMNEQVEEKWYSSPEGVFTITSNIYSLGVLLFELLGRFDSEKAHAAAMLNIQHRILPPKFLSENPKEAGFCIWLLHPEPLSRPTTREIIQSEVISGSPEVFTKELSLSIEEQDAESELLQHFLVILQEGRQKQAYKLAEDINCLETDIEEVKRRHSGTKPLPLSCTNTSTSELVSQLPPVSVTNETSLIRNINQLEKAYYSMRSKSLLPETNNNLRTDRGLLKGRDKCNVILKNKKIEDQTDHVGAFFDGLCKYARYNKFEVRGVLKNVEFNSSANVICSMSFDRDEDYFATAGVSKKIKIYEFEAIFNPSVDVQYPVTEMPNRSKLSCVCWNNYVKNYLASSDYDGTVKLWDVSTGQTISQFREHEKRAWSVDFSPVNPTILASGGDDYTVKLWNIHEKNCSGTIRSKANVCSVQFSAHSTHLLAFGSADYKTYCYDLRNTRSPWCVLAGHEKAVSYVKFLDKETLVTASTDNSLKLWDLNKTTNCGLSTSACSLTLSGHTNEKNFVGLSTWDGYIACGSETNEVYAYHRSFSMPITSYTFGSIDPISGKETDDDNGLFVSNVCWRGKSDMVIAASSSGCIKVLQMV